jgi:hypothetical protein
MNNITTKEELFKILKDQENMREYALADCADDTLKQIKKFMSIINNEKETTLKEANEKTKNSKSIRKYKNIGLVEFYIFIIFLDVFLKYNFNNLSLSIIINAILASGIAYECNSLNKIANSISMEAEELRNSVKEYEEEIKILEKGKNRIYKAKLIDETWRNLAVEHRMNQGSLDTMPTIDEVAEYVENNYNLKEEVQTCKKLTRNNNININNNKKKR